MKTYGDVTAEYRALTETVGKVDTTHELIWVEGPDAVSFLDGIVSQEVAGMEPGEVARSLLLSPEGKLQALLWLLKEDGRVGILTDPGRGELVAEQLGFYRIRVKAEIRIDDRPGWALLGPRAVPAVGLDNPERWEEHDGLLVAPVPLPGTTRVVGFGGPSPEGVPSAGELAATAVRVEGGEPVMGRDVDESTIPHSSGLVAEAVSFAKGCFLGYELVERLESRGATPPRRLMGVAVTRNVLPPEGAELMSGDVSVGTLTSVAESLRVGAPIGLSLLKRSVEAGDEVEVRWEGGSAPAVVRSLPFL